MKTLSTNSLAFALLAFLPQLATAQNALQVSEPVWAKPDQFWFRKSVPGGNVWLTVDAQHGVKEPLFDHQRLALELTLRSGVQYEPLTLPFADSATQFVVKYDGSNAYIQEGALAIEFIHGAQHWRCELQIKWDWNKVPPTDYECLPRRPASAAPPLPDTRAPRVSPDGQWEALIDNYNVIVRAVGATGGDVIRLSSDGTATDAYQLGSIHWSPDAQSLSAYRVHADVWLAEGVSGNVKKFITRRDWAVPKG